ncbi:hypothetical protein VTJ04DRAFT_4655 [Mycothermus thermophilus]|uniref:uncharacterized protein n=1 Tax=Humicola insolens TaxID=85995 RepID=UPI003744A91B
MALRRDAKDEDDDYDDIPLQHQRPFGTGMYKRPIAFVSASSLSTVQPNSSSTSQSNTGASVADLYLKLVLPDDSTTQPRSKSAPPSSTTTGPAVDTTATTTTTTTPPSEPTSSESTSSQPTQAPNLCPICKLPLPPSSDPQALAAHNASLTHQLSLPYSPPPSALDRTRMGLAYLSAHGWDPDSRRGLGAEEQGLRFPLKAKQREERLGLGAAAPKKEEKKPKEKLLDAGKVRKLAAEEKRRKEEIREALFGDGKLEKYLGVGGRGVSLPGSRSASKSRGLG